MRNTETDQLGSALQSAFLKSGMSVEGFAQHVYESRDAVIAIADDSRMLTVVGDAIYTFYFAANSWFCKI